MLNYAKRSITEHLPTAYHSARNLKRDLANLLYRKTVVERAYGGHRLKVHLHDSMARAWYDCSWSHLPEIDLLRQHGLRDGAVVFDLGAHQNIVAMVLAREVQPAGRVIAVEGSAHNVKVGRLNAQANDFDNLTTIHAVVGAAEGRIAFAQSYNGEVIATKKQSRLHSLPAVTIDGLAREHGKPDIVFVDIEGYEMEAIRGAAETLREPATWFIELHGDAALAKFGTSNRAVAEIFAKAYKRYFRYEDNGPFEEVSATAAIPSERFWLIAAPDNTL